MKKLFYVIAMLCVSALAITSCKKDEGKDENKVTKRLAMCGDEWDKYAFTYGADGKVAVVNRNEGERVWTFTWNGNQATVAYVKEGEDQTPLSFTLAANGYVSTFTDTWGDVRNMAYTADGYLSKVDKAGDIKCNCVWENGDLVKWSRFDPDEQFKMQSFFTDKENIGGIFPDATDKAGLDRWMFELGFFGKPSKHLLDQAAWDGSSSVATHEYEYDEDGYVTKVTKYYDTEVDQVYEYSWEVVK